MANYEGERVKLTNTQLSKLKTFEDEELRHELFLTTRQTTKVRNAFANNMSTDIKVINAQISKII